MMKALQSKGVQLAVVGLVVAIAAAYGIAIEQEGLLALVALVAAVAGGIAGRFVGEVAAVAVAEEQVQERSLVRIWDQMAMQQAKAHEQALDRPFVYPVLYPDGAGDDEDDVISLATVVADLSERVTMMEARLAECEADS